MKEWKRVFTTSAILASSLLCHTGYAIKAPILDHHLVFQIPTFFNTQTVYTTPYKAWQIVSNFDYAKVGKNDYFYEIPFEVSYGISNRWMADVSWSPLNIINLNNGQNARGIGNASIGTKYRFPYIRGSDFSGALGMSIDFPLADVNKRLTQGNIQYFPYGVLAYNFPAMGYTQYILQGGFDFLQRVKRNSNPRHVKPASTEIIINTGFDIPSNHINYLLMFNFVNNQWSGGDTNIFAFNPGIMWQPVSSFTSGVSVPLRLNKGADQLGVEIFLNYTFAV